MMKLVISFDEIGLDNGFSEFNSEKAEEKLNKFLENQFSMWEIATAFPYSTEYDFDNMEIHLLMDVIT